MTAPQSPTLWTPTFILLCRAQFFGSSQHALPQPTFPLYITSLCGTPFQVGLVLACFVLQALALLMLAYAANLLAVMISGVLYMLGLAMSSSTTMAIAMEQAKPERRGHRRGRALDHHRQPRAA
jgi:MFS family permease